MSNFKINVFGRGGELCIGTIDKKLAEQCINEGFDILDGEEAQDWSEIDDILHIQAPFTETIYFVVENEDGEIIENTFDEDDIKILPIIFPKPPEDFKDDYVLMSFSYAKGNFGSFEIETDEFDINKLLLISINLDEWLFQNETLLLMGLYGENVDKLLEQIEEKDIKGEPFINGETLSEQMTEWEKLAEDFKLETIYLEDGETYGKGLFFYLLHNNEIICEES